MPRRLPTLAPLARRVGSCFPLHRRAALAVLVASAACSSGTGPDGGGTAGKTHPAGTVADRITFASGHIGIAVGPDGVGYVSSPTGLDRFSTQSPYTKLSSVTTGYGPRDIVIDRAGTTAYAATDQGKVYVVDLAAGTMKATLGVGDTTLGGDARQHKLALSPDGSRAYLVVWGRLWSVPTSGAPSTSVPWNGQAIAVNPSSGAIYVSNADNNVRISRVDPPTLLAAATSSETFNSTVIAVAPGGDEVYVDDPGGILHVLDPTTLAERGQVSLPSSISGIAVTPDGKQIYVAQFDSKLTIVDRATRTVVSTLTLGGYPLDVAFDPEGTTAFVVNLDSWVDVIK